MALLLTEHFHWSGSRKSTGQRNSITNYSKCISCLAYCLLWHVDHTQVPYLNAKAAHVHSLHNTVHIQKEKKDFKQISHPFGGNMSCSFPDMSGALKSVWKNIIKTPQELKISHTCSIREVLYLFHFSTSFSFLSFTFSFADPLRSFLVRGLPVSFRAGMWL